MTGTAPCLEVSELDAWYGQAQALRSISMQVGRGELIGIFGRNGAGKSTTLRVLSRLHRRATGQIDFYGQSILGMNAEQVAILGMGLVREGAKVYENLTVGEHFQLGRRLGERRGQEMDMDEVMTWFPALRDRMDEKGGYLSGGQRQMLSIGVALLSRPRCLLLDEPSAGLAEGVAESVYAVIRQIATGDVSLVIAEQDARWLKGLADRGYILDNGVVEREVQGADLAAIEHSWMADL